MTQGQATPSPSRSPAELVSEAKLAMQRGDEAKAETLLREAARIAPGDGALLHNLALLLHNTKRSAEAATVLEPILASNVTFASLLLLGDIYEATGRQSEAFRCYKTILKTSPKNYDALMKLGPLKDKMGDKPGARDCYRLAMEARPLDWEASHQYILSIWDKDPGPAVEIAERLLEAAKDPESRVRALNLLICRKEWWERIRRGEMPYHAISVDELLFKHSLGHLREMESICEGLLAASPDSVSLQVTLGNARFCLKDRHGAEALFNRVGDKTKGHILETVRFAPGFYDELRAFKDEDLVRELPPVIVGAPPTPDSKGTLYLSCNFFYFKAFALPMIVSLRERSPRTPVHVHIMDASVGETDFALAFLKNLAPLRFALTVERPGLQAASGMEARCYYHAIRFIRYFHHLKEYGCPLWLMDVDAVINRDLTDMFTMLEGHDASMRIRPARMEAWNQFNACIVGASMSSASIDYFKLVAAYIAYFHQRKTLRWGIDQLAMYGAFADMQDHGTAPALALLGDREVDYDYREDGFVWCNSGAGKFKHLQRISQPGTLPLANFEGNKFVGVFECYWKETQRIAGELGVSL